MRVRPHASAAGHSPVAAQRPQLAFIYGARDGLWPGMGRALFDEAGAIRDALLRCEQIIATQLGWSLRKASEAERPFAEPVKEPLTTAVQIALTAGWRERGIEPDVLVARCGGEFAAAYVQGVLTLDDAMEMACRVSHVIRQGRGAGRMLALRCDMDEVERLQQSDGPRFYLVSDEVEDTTVIGCETAQVANVTAFLAEHRIEASMLPSRIAPHSPIVEDWKSEMLKPLSGIAPGPRRLPYYSAAAAGPVPDEAIGTAHFWRAMRGLAMVRRPLHNAVVNGCGIFVEISGNPTLGSLIRERGRAAGKKVVSLPTMRRHQSVRAVMDATAAALARFGAVRADLEPKRALRL